MFIFYFAKSMAIILAYIISAITFAVLILYIRQFTMAIIDKTAHRPATKLDTLATALVFTGDIGLFVGSVHVIIHTSGWQMEIFKSLVLSMTQQPAFALLLIPLIGYPALSLKKLAAQTDK